MSCLSVNRCICTYIYIYSTSSTTAESWSLVGFSWLPPTQPNPQSVDFSGSVGCVGESVFSLEVTRYIYIYIRINGFLVCPMITSMVGDHWDCGVAFARILGGGGFNRNPIHRGVPWNRWWRLFHKFWSPDQPLKQGSKQISLPETNILVAPKNECWNTTFPLLGWSIFRGYVGFREGKWMTKLPRFVLKCSLNGSPHHSPKNCRKTQGQPTQMVCFLQVLHTLVRLM